MKTIKFIVIFFYVQIVQSQIKTDTIFGLNQDIYSIYKSKVHLINKAVDMKKIPQFEIIDLKKNIENLPEYETLSLLQNINKTEKTSIFNQYEYFIISYYSNTNNLFTETRLFEFYFASKEKAKKCVDVLKNIKLNSIKNKDEDIWNQIGVLNWYFIQDDKRVYFVHLRMPDNENPMRIILEKRIKEILSPR